MSSTQASSYISRNNVNITGKGTQPILFIHGYGCDQNMWRFVYPSFENDFKVILMDLTGSGKSDESQYSYGKYDLLDAHADDLLSICEELELQDVILVGHSVSAMISVLAVNKEPKRFSKLILVGPSPKYINDGDYLGGFNIEDIEDLMTALDSNYLGWASQMGPAIMGIKNKVEHHEELTNSFCRTNPEIAKHFARVTFLSDNRKDLLSVTVPTLILQCSEDVIAPRAVGEYVHQQIKNSSFKLLKATGHCPHLSAPEETVEAMQDFFRE